MDGNLVGPTGERFFWLADGFLIEARMTDTSVETFTYSDPDADGWYVNPSASDDTTGDTGDDTTDGTGDDTTDGSGDDSTDGSGDDSDDDSEDDSDDDSEDDSDDDSDLPEDITSVSFDIKGGRSCRQARCGGRWFAAGSRY